LLLCMHVFMQTGFELWALHSITWAITPTLFFFKLGYIHCTGRIHYGNSK
jgi:hypothetical protein